MVNQDVRPAAIPLLPAGQPMSAVHLTDSSYEPVSTCRQNPSFVTVAAAAQHDMGRERVGQDLQRALPVPDHGPLRADSVDMREEDGPVLGARPDRVVQGITGESEPEDAPGMARLDGAEEPGRCCMPDQHTAIHAA
eukprot:767916-Hanusia_phi.AAC.2